MKMIYKIVPAIFVVCFLTVGCDKMLEVNSDRVLPTAGNKLNSYNNNLYYMSGIFSLLPKIAERYVLLGELRGDLMDVTKNATIDLQQINNFDISPDNPYVTIKDYYAVINNCNYLINNIDTSVVTGGVKAMYREYAAVKAIRAWTYMQIALNYGKAVYYEQPLLNLNDATKSYPEYGITELSAILISDLLPWIDVEKPQYGSGIDPESFEIGELNSKYFYLPIRFLLGELYLWSGQYENAANEYRDLMYLNSVVTNYKNQTGYEAIRSIRSVVNGEFVGITYRWMNIFEYSQWEVLSEIGTTSLYGEGSHLKDLAVSKYMLKPSATSIANWDNQIYYDVNPLYMTFGDLRGYYGSYISMSSNNNGTGRSVAGEDNYIFKYTQRDALYKQSELITTCRAGLLYLRYAEAVNRIGKPNLAFAVLKNGLNLTNVANPAIVPANESPNPKPNYMNFDDVRFAENIGMHARGCGYVEKAANYIIPSLGSLQDSVLYVEDLIQKELALETAFEGNRFHDLMRLALRRNNPSYLANLVAEKHTDNKEAIRAKLMNTDNWYLPKK